MIINVGITGSFLIVLIILAFVFFLKETIDSLENKCFKKLIPISIFGLFIEGLIYSITLQGISPDSIFLNVCVILLYVYYVLWMYYFVLYGYIVLFGITNKNDKKYSVFKKVITVLYAIFMVLSIVLPFDISITDSFYPYGIGTTAQYIMVTLGMGIIFVSGTINRNRLKNKEIIPLIACIIFGAISVVVQYYHHEFLFIVPAHAIVIILMFFTIENPDLKMLEEVSSAKDQADKANRAKSDFLSSMSHEIRTPLNAIVGLSEDIATYMDQVPPEVVEDTKDIQNASQTLLEIVGNILDISKIESNKMEIVNAPYNLKEEVEGLCKVTSTRIGDKPIDYTLTIAPDIPYELIGDKGKVKEIVNNLFTNSIKYTERGQINLSIKCVNDFNNMYSTLYITCQDTGRGIKAENISRLFDKFDRLDVERNTTAEGTGLGLAITKKMIEMMGGKINVSSQFGVGSIFMVAIPQKISKISKPEGEQELSDTAKLAQSNFDLGQRRVLIVDDNNLNIKVATKALKDFNFDLDSCNSGQECLDKVASGEHYDLILMDIMMPGMSGDTTLHKLLDTGNFTTPVIALTADAVAGAQEKYISAGFVDYIAKPFSRDQIKGKLEKIFVKGNNQ